MRIVFVLIALAYSLTSQANWTLVDDFESYTVGDFDNNAPTDPDTDADVANGGPWMPNSSTSLIAVEQEAGPNNYLALGWNSSTQDGVYRNLGSATLAQGDTATYYFQIGTKSTTTVDMSFGLSDNASIGSWGDFEVQVILVDDNAGTTYLAARNGGSAVNLVTVNADVWYNIWLVVDNDSDTYDVYFGTGLGPGDMASATQIADDFAFRNGTTSALSTIGMFGWNTYDLGTELDNIQYNPDVGSTMLLDDFSGDLSAYTGTRILDSDGGTHNTAIWQIAGGALELNTSTQVSFAEQYAFICAGLSLGVNEEIQADFNVSGSQDLGLYVGGTTPATDVRQDYVSVYARGGGGVYSRGFDGTTDYGLAGAGSLTYDKLFIKRTATNTYEAGYYNGTNRNVIVTRTPSTPNDGDVVGFYADVRSAGILGSVDNLALISPDVTDVDGDGLLDSWEQQIIDDNPGDAIEDIYDVMPGDDYDGDGYTNEQEYELGIDPTVQDDSNMDNDGDYLPDLWELNNLGGLSYNSYDDPDNDGYNNQAERVGNTDPLLDADYPDFMSPSVGYLRDSVVASNACLMGGGIYGRAINGVSFQDQIIYTFNGYQYTAYYDTVGSVQMVCLARRTVNEIAVGEWEIYQTDSEFTRGDEGSWDAHNVIAFGICPEDGTLHIAWDHHGQTLRYRRSVVGLCTSNTNAWGSGMLNAEQNWLVDASTTEYDVTYPQFITTPSGGLVLDRRYHSSGNGDQYLQFYNPGTGAWAAHIEFINRSGNYNGSTSRCAYLNGFDFGPDGTIYVTWTWREGATGTGNHDICYAYSPDNGIQWYNNAGTLIADTSTGETITLDTPGIIIKGTDQHQLIINQQAQCVDNDGCVHALMLHRREDPGYAYPNITTADYSTLGVAYYHYFRDPFSGEWTQRRIPPDVYQVGSRPCIGYDANGNVYAAFVSYPTGINVVPGYYYGKLVVASASKASDYTDWEILQVIDGPFDGEPLLDQARLLSDNILAVFIQEHAPYVDGDGIPTPLHVYEFAIDIPAPVDAYRIAYTFMGDDVIISTFGQSGSDYQLQTSFNLANSNGWSNVGLPVSGSDSLIAFPDVDGLQSTQSFYKVMATPAP